MANDERVAKLEVAVARDRRPLSCPAGKAAVDPFWMYYGSMTNPNTVTLSIKNVPAEVARRLKARAERNHRSLQGELMAVVEEASRELSVEDLAAFASRVGLRTPAEAARFVRADRDGRDGRRR